jgi:hypothetical protein
VVLHDETLAAGEFVILRRKYDDLKVFRDHLVTENALTVFGIIDVR